MFYKIADWIGKLQDVKENVSHSLGYRSCQDLQDVSKIRITGFRLDIDGSSVEDIESGLSRNRRKAP